MIVSHDAFTSIPEIPRFRLLCNAIKLEHAANAIMMVRELLEELFLEAVALHVMPGAKMLHAASLLQLLLLLCSQVAATAKFPEIRLDDFLPDFFYLAYICLAAIALDVRVFL